MKYYILPYDMCLHLGCGHSLKEFLEKNDFDAKAIILEDKPWELSYFLSGNLTKEQEKKLKSLNFCEVKSFSKEDLKEGFAQNESHLEKIYKEYETEKKSKEKLISDLLTEFSKELNKKSTLDIAFPKVECLSVYKNEDKSVTCEIVCTVTMKNDNNTK